MREYLHLGECLLRYQTRIEPTSPGPHLALVLTSPGPHGILIWQGACLLD